MRYLTHFGHFLCEELQSYQFELISDDPFIYKYSFQDVVGNQYLVEFKNIPIRKVGQLSHVYELLYYVEDDGQYSVYKIVNVNPYRVLKTVFGDILNDFTKRCQWVKIIYFVGLAKETEKQYVTSRTRIYKRYLDMNPVSGFRIQQSGNAIQLTKI